MGNKGYNTCKMGINRHEFRNLTIENIPALEGFTVSITKENALIEFRAKYISLCDPNVYMTGLEDCFF